MMIEVQNFNWDVDNVPIHHGILNDVLHYKVFKGLQVFIEQIKPCPYSLVGFLGEQILVKGYITLNTTFGTPRNSETIKAYYLAIHSSFSSYNIIIGRPAFYALGSPLSTWHLNLKYPFDNNNMGVIKGDQDITRQCYIQII